jgi:multidrug transporter EmrE-like cation transporter
MSRQVEFVLLQIVVAINAALCAKASQYVKDGGPWYVYYVPGILSMTLWPLIARRTPYSLLFSGVLWDVIYSAVWVLVLAYLAKDSITRWQVIGSLVVIIGLAVMGIGQKD